MATNKPLVTHMYTADPRVHVFEGKLYIYPSHDIDTGISENNDGDHFDMRDFHVFSMEEIGGEIKDHGVALDIKDIPWARRQLWSNDAAYKDGKYYLYFPVKDKNDIFRLGVGISDYPYGPFKPEPEPMKNSFSIDPCVFKDDDGEHYMYWGGLWGGQLQQWSTGKYDATVPPEPGEGRAIGPRVARLRKDMLNFEEESRELVILGPDGNPLLAPEHDKRFFEASWMHKHNGKYYFSYSTGNTCQIVYATGDTPYGPFTYQGVVLTPVLGWATHHAIVEFKGKWYLFYHDSELSGGKTHLRNIKVSNLIYRQDGSIVTIDGRH